MRLSVKFSNKAKQIGAARYYAMELKLSAGNND